VIVVDASALIELLLLTPAAGDVARHLFVPGQTLHAPHLLDVEIAQVLRRYALAGEIDGERAREAIADLADFPLHRYPHTVLLPRIWALRHKTTAYDAAYVALAEALNAALLTCDRRLAAAGRPHVQVVQMEQPAAVRAGCALAAHQDTSRQVPSRDQPTLPALRTRATSAQPPRCHAASPA
jgi:predicted nucleic acid-binding protein